MQCFAVLGNCKASPIKGYDKYIVALSEDELKRFGEKPRQLEAKFGVSMMTICYKKPKLMSSVARLFGLQTGKYDQILSCSIINCITIQEKFLATER